MKIVAASGSKFAQFLIAAGFALAISTLPAWAGGPPANDNFSDRTALMGQSTLVSTYNTNATVEPGDPSLGNRTLTHTLWWSWTAPYTGWANFSTFGSDGPLVVGVFTGDSLPELSSVGVSNGGPWTLRYGFYYYQWMTGDSVNVPVESGTAYQIIVGASAFSAASIGRVVLGINQAPTILSGSVVSGTTGGSLSYQVSASNWPTTYGAQGLPDGLTIDPYSGIISGAPTSIGSFDSIVSATGPGGTGQATVRFEITQASSPLTAPVFTSGNAINKGTVGALLPISVYVTGATQITADTLPPGLALSDHSQGGYAILSGTPTQVGTFTVPIHASNSIGTTDAKAVFQIRDKPPLPVFYRSAVTYATVGTPFSCWIDASDMTDGSYEVGTLPPGLRLSDTTTISGTPTLSGTFEIPVKATNPAGSTSAILTIVVADNQTAPQPSTPTAAPVITSSAGASGLAGTNFYYYANSSDPNAQYAATGLPPGLSIDPTTGLISGSPTSTGTYLTSITATNPIGSTTTPLTLLIQGFSPFVLTSSAMATGTVGTPFTYSFTAVSSPGSSRSQFPIISVKAADLPPGLSYTPASYNGLFSPIGTISGTPTTAGIYRIPLTVTYQYTTISATLTLVVTASVTQAPVITSAATAQGNVGRSFSYTITGSTSTASYSATGLPPGLGVNTSSGAIFGTPTQKGTYIVDIAATNSVGTGHAKLTISIQAAQLVDIQAPPAISGTVGRSFYQYIPYSNPLSDSPKFSVSGLPPGLTFSAYEDISGTPTTAGTFPVTISFSNASGTASVVENIIIAAKPSPPVLSSAIMTIGHTGDSFYYSVDTSGNSPSIQFSGLPPGLVASGGQITGTPTQSGIFPVSVTAIDDGGTCTGTLTIRIDPPAPPILTLPASILIYAGEIFDYSIPASNDITSYEISGKLPAGMTFDSTRHRLTGTPSEVGSFASQITATGPGGSTTAPFMLYVVNQPLPIISAPLVVYQSSSTYISASNATTSLSAQGLPANLTFSNYGSYGYVSGSIATAGTYPATITATNRTGSSSEVVNFTTNSSLSYGFNSAMTSAVVNELFSYDLYWGGDAFMANRTYSAIGLPLGLAIDPSTGKITGTPTTPGTYPVNITATHSSYATVQFTLTILVNAAPDLPQITSNSILNAICGQRPPFDINATGEITSYALDPIPPGLFFDSTTGGLSGKPTVPGTYLVKASVTNAAGTRTVDLVIQIAAAPDIPVLNSSMGFQGSVGEKFSHSLAATNSPTSYSATGLPPGLSLDATGGNISGTPTVAGHYIVPVSATNAGGTTMATLSIDIIEAKTPVISSRADVTGALGGFFFYYITGSESPTSFAASNLPPGLNLNSKTGEITGTPTTTGDYKVLVSASNAALTGSATITIHIPSESAGQLSSAAQATCTLGANAILSLSSNETSTFTAEGLPPGLTLPEGSAKITGIPTTAGHYETIVHVQTGNIQTQSILSIDVAEAPSQPPVISCPLSAWVGSGSICYIGTSNQATQVTFENLPDGLTFDPETGIISGTPKLSGFFGVTIHATNAAGNSTAFVTLETVAPVVPSITTGANIYLIANSASKLPISLNTDGFSPFNSSYARAYLYYPYWYNRYPYYGPGHSSTIPSLPTTITAKGLPPGLIFNPATQEIEGTATRPGDYMVTLTAATLLSDVTTSITIHVAAIPISSTDDLRVSSSVYLNAFGAVGSPFTLDVVPSGLATDVNCTGLPSGLGLQKTSGSSNGVQTTFAAITGSPVKAGTYPVKFTFANSKNTASGTVTIVVPDTPELPSFSGSLAASGVVGRPFSYYVGDGSGYGTNSGVSLNNGVATGEGTSMINVSGLPPGLLYNSSSNYITGTPTTAGSYVVPISLTNAGGTTSASVLITISDQQLAVPQILGTNGSLGASTVSFAGEPIHLSLNAANSTTNVTASGLPDGVTLGKAADGSWTLSGTPTTAGAYNLFLTATSDQGTETVPLTLNIRQLDQSIPAPQPDAMPSPSPTPVSTPPTVVVNQQRVDTTDDQVSIRGRVLAYQLGCTVTVKAGAQSWQKLRVSPNGSFKLNLANLPVGTTHVTIRTRDSEGHVRTTRIQVHRHVA